MNLNEKMMVDAHQKSQSADASEISDQTRRNILGAAILGASGLAVAGVLAERRYQLTGRYLNAMRLSDFALAALGVTASGFSAADLKKGPALVSIIASWCPYCRSERQALANLIRRNGLVAYAAMVQDKQQAATQFFSEFGNPFAAVGDDASGHFMRMMGARGVPATFLTRPDADGAKVVFSSHGAMDEAELAELQKKIDQLKS
jgi:thiol-disulfide isomerase/thioredoxin